jgi:phosphoribosyl 1,2-cyclic phosphodiesterase
MVYRTDVQFTVLSSGSKGNALWVESHGVGLLVEAGLSPRRLRQRLEAAGLSGRAPAALLITHAHHDHVNHAPEVAGGFGIATLATQATADERTKGGVPLTAHVPLVVGSPARVGHLSVHAFSTPHDAPGSVGLVIEDGDHRVGIVTDLGCVTHGVVNALKDCSLLYAEFNHDVQMLMDGPYPQSLKQRCRSNVGHLSNEQGADLVKRARGPLLRTLLLAHLSESNNTPELAMWEARRVLDGADVDIRIAPQRCTLGPLNVAPSRSGRSSVSIAVPAGMAARVPAGAPVGAATPSGALPPAFPEPAAPASPSFRPVVIPPQPERPAPVYAVVGARVKRAVPQGSGPSAQLSLFV